MSKINNMSNILVGMFLHYLLYINKKTKSYTTITSASPNDIERRVAYMIKSMLTKILNSKPEVAAMVSRISMRNGQITLYFNHFGGSLWGRENDLINKLVKGFVSYSMRTRYFAGIDEETWPLRIDVNQASFTFSMGRNYYQSDASSYNSQRNNDDIQTRDITTPLKDKVRSLYSSIVNIPIIFEDVVQYRINLRERLCDQATNTLNTTFRYSLFDLYLGYVESGASAYMFRGNNPDTVMAPLREITLMLKAIFSSNMPHSFYTETIYADNNTFFADMLDISNMGVNAMRDPGRFSRVSSLRDWIRDTCQINGIEVITLNPVAAPPVATLDDPVEQEVAEENWDDDDDGDF